MRPRTLLLPAIAFMTIACAIDSVTGPSSGRPYASLSYSIHARGSECGSFTDFIGLGVLVADVPSDWQFDAARFSGLFAGQPVSGDGVLNACDSIFVSPPPASGFQRFCIVSSKALRLTTEDEATIVVTFRAGGTVGEFPLQFRAGAYVPITAACVQPTASQYSVSIQFNDAPPAVPVLSSRGLFAFTSLLALLATARLRAIGR
ncbi:MAG: hypothetical protein U0529_14330 [Thermoanaerobaculia bacterium]